MTHLPNSRSASITSNDVAATPSNPSTPLSDFPTSFSPPQLSTPSKVPHIPGAVKVLPLASSVPSTPHKGQNLIPTPAPRKHSLKIDTTKLNNRRPRIIDPQNRFSTVFGDQDVEAFINLQKSITDMTGKINQDFSSNKKGKISDSSRSKSHENLSQPNTTATPKHLPRLAPLSDKNLSPFSSSENILQPEVLTPSPGRSNKSSSFNDSTLSPNLKTKPRASTDVPNPAGTPKLPERKLST